MRVKITAEENAAETVRPTDAEGTMTRIVRTCVDLDDLDRLAAVAGAVCAALPENIPDELVDLLYDETWYAVARELERNGGCR